MDTREAEDVIALWQQIFINFFSGLKDAAGLTSFWSNAHDDTCGYAPKAPADKIVITQFFLNVLNHFLREKLQGLKNRDVIAWACSVCTKIKQVVTCLLKPLSDI